MSAPELAAATGQITGPSLRDSFASIPAQVYRAIPNCTRPRSSTPPQRHQAGCSRPRLTRSALGARPGAHAASHRLAALFEVATSTGARRGEICGLRWTDVDLQARTITIATQRVMVGWQATEDEPKSEMSKRVVALDEATAVALRAHRKQQLADRLAWQDAWTESGKVFVREDGEALHPAGVTLLFNRLAFGAGLPPIRFHDLRHGAATYALAAGVDVKVVQERLGHSTSALTRDVYTSVLPEVARAAAETVAAMIPRRVTR